MNFPDIQRVALWWGPGVLVLIAFGYGLLRLAQYWIEKSMEVKRQQMDGAYGLVRQYIEKFLGAQSGQADALSRLANSVEHRESQESFEHQEILIALKALHRDMNGLRCRQVEDYGAPRITAGFAGLCASSPDLSREPHSPGFSSTRGLPEMTAEATGVEREQVATHPSTLADGVKKAPGAGHPLPQGRGMSFHGNPLTRPAPADENAGSGTPSPPRGRG
jgi:hypothetical protein